MLELSQDTFFFLTDKETEAQSTHRKLGMKPETWGEGAGSVTQGLFLFFFLFSSTKQPLSAYSKNFEEEKCHLAKSRKYCQGGASWMASILQASQGAISQSSNL